MASCAQLLALGLPVVRPCGDGDTLAALSAAAVAFGTALSAEAPTAPWRQELPLPGAYLIREAFSPQEATPRAAAVRLAHGGRAPRTAAEQRRGSQHHRPVTAALEVLARRLRPLLPAQAGPSCKAPLEAEAISSFLRCYRYLPGDRSEPHWDRSYCH